MAPDTKTKQFFNQSRQAVLATHVREAKSFLTRARGLLFAPPLKSGEGLLIDPCQSIHMFGMAYAIDAVFFDANFRVVGLVEAISPGQISRYYPSARSCLELVSGAIAASGTREGDEFIVTDSA